MQVWVLSESEGTGAIAVFSSREKAEDYARKVYDITEWIIGSDSYYYRGNYSMELFDIL